MDISGFYNLNPTELSAAVIFFNLFFSLVLQLVIVYVYKKTRHGLSHSQSFIFTIIIVGTLCTAIMMAVQNNIVGAFAIFAAFTLIRFRTILKEPSDLAYVFFALVIGIASGMSHYSLALITVLFLSLIIYLFHRFGFGNISDNFDYLFIFSADDTFSLDAVKQFLGENVESHELLRARYNGGDRNEFSMSIRLKESDDLNKITDFLKKTRSIKKLEVMTGKSTSEY
ncbi:MAG: hypothetical protein A3G52_02340 [Candidatus Taylorbacteria bacterium RIFCSPLOWO2_12_FULL_43_20]|uniref:DUF4956 domain-containing protein n=1 Tax=Candidatus Taylorbacteria bacterium RIFCSPLOWO2_12_FULL_43_20 TaxID=1802332 RepID=A0A1G2P5M2_9BACT|nr:MAG: hypothetical protein A3E92_02735 [Candidatus Taylorbacteria bacterium RIFCSPHIGHO2_12_FULL_42_34]OHA42932.1 MAG: hypothetical protein A3G52_02340 [Candidatus Taylorbacteria bacterium RIFCSPLOWO2_12_FULL_43_20]